MTKSYEEMRVILEQQLTPSRYQHSLGVADTAAALARRFGMNEERAHIAGLLHDCGRVYGTAELPTEARRRGIPIGKIYYADMIEPSRAYPEVEHLRELARTASLDEMMLIGLTESILFVAQKGGLIHPDTITARNELILNRR